MTDVISQFASADFTARAENDTLWPLIRNFDDKKNGELGKWKKSQEEQQGRDQNMCNDTISNLHLSKCFYVWVCVRTSACAL